jgi:NinB protein
VIFRLVHDQARARALEAVKSAPEGYVVRIGPPTRSLEANAALHAELTEIAETMQWAGKPRSVECWKRLLVSAWLRARGESVEMLPALDGHGIDIVYAPTSQMTGAQIGELMDYIGAWRANA